MNKLGRFGAKNTDIALSVLVVIIICLMIIPVPNPMIDGLLAVNISLSVILLMTALYVPGVTALSTFPSLLLFTTLFRLSLNVTTTRKILLDADAGKIIETFGAFVISGDFVVGAVIFLIILIVQFIVITKGAERVAEVAARFTLDAMPGKQMSVDSDLRAGLIDNDEAQSKRKTLETENQLYGAMDGAMKFVKGDAIAGLIITAINIIAGLLIGVAKRGMDFGDALETYSILTIGDGLVSQLPALLIALTSGIVVTRVGGGKKDPLGTDIFAQVSSEPKALMLAAVVVFLLGLIPGFPILMFATIAAILGGSSYYIMKDRNRSGMVGGKLGQKAADPNDREKHLPNSITTQISPELGSERDWINNVSTNTIATLIPQFGIPIPAAGVEVNRELEGNKIRVLMHGIPLRDLDLYPDQVLVMEEESTLEMLGLPANHKGPDIDGLESWWTERSAVEVLEENEISYYEGLDAISPVLESCLADNVQEFIGFQETSAILDQVRKELPTLVNEVERLLPLQIISEIFQRLIEDGVPLTQVRQILEALIEHGQNEKDAVRLTDFIRQSLKRFITSLHQDDNGEISAYLLDPQLEDQVRQAIKQSKSGSYLALDPDQAKVLINTLKEQMMEDGAAEGKSHFGGLYLLCSMDVRRYVAKLVDKEIPRLKVLAHQEILETIKINPLGRVKEVAEPIDLPQERSGGAPDMGGGGAPGGAGLGGGAGGGLNLGGIG